MSDTPKFGIRMRELFPDMVPRPMRDDLDKTTIIVVIPWFKVIAFLNRNIERKEVVVLPKDAEYQYFRFNCGCDVILRDEWYQDDERGRDRFWSIPIVPTPDPVHKAIPPLLCGPTGECESYGAILMESEWIGKFCAWSHKPIEESRVLAECDRTRIPWVDWKALKARHNAEDKWVAVYG